MTGEFKNEVAIGDSLGIFLLAWVGGHFLCNSEPLTVQNFGTRCKGIGFKNIKQREVPLPCMAGSVNSICSPGWWKDFSGSVLYGKFSGNSPQRALA